MKPSKTRKRRKRPKRLNAVKKLLKDKETRALIIEIIRAIISAFRG